MQCKELCCAVRVCKFHELTFQFSAVRRHREHHVVDVIDHVLGRDHVAAEVTSVETANSVLAALHTVKLDVDLTVVGIERHGNVDDNAVFVFAFLLDVVFELLLPAIGVAGGFPKGKTS